MTTILDESLYSHRDRIKGKVVLITGETAYTIHATRSFSCSITGAAAGIGRETALQFARHGQVSFVRFDRHLLTLGRILQSESGYRRLERERL